MILPCRQLIEESERRNPTTHNIRDTIKKIQNSELSCITVANCLLQNKPQFLFKYEEREKSLTLK